MKKAPGLLWRVDAQIPWRRSRVVGWWNTRKGAQKFIDELAALPCQIIRDEHPEKHRDWPRELTAAERKYLRDEKRRLRKEQAA